MNKVLNCLVINLAMFFFSGYLACDAEIAETLIRGLRSPNSPPPKNGFSHAYNREAQEEIYWRIQLLAKIAGDHLEAIYSHVHDEEYCFSEANESRIHVNITVGNVCSRILQDSFVPQHWSLEPFCRQQLDARIRWDENESLFEHWKKNRDIPLYQFQIKSLDNQISGLERLSFENTDLLRKPNSIDEKYFEVLRTQMKTRLTILRDVLVETKTPLASSTDLTKFVGRPKDPLRE